MQYRFIYDTNYSPGEDGLANFSVDVEDGAADITPIYVGYDTNDQGYRLNASFGEASLSLSSLVRSLESHFKPNSAVFPDLIMELTIRSLEFGFVKDKDTSTIQFSGAVLWPIDSDTLLEAHFSIKLNRDGNDYGSIKVGFELEDFSFDLLLDRGDAQFMLAVCHSEEKSVDISRLLKSISSKDISKILPDTLEIALKSLVLGVYTPSKQANEKESKNARCLAMAIEIDMGDGIQFSEDLPLLGEILKENNFGVTSLRMVALNNHIDNFGLKLLKSEHALFSMPEEDEGRGLDKGVYLATTLIGPGFKKELKTSFKKSTRADQGSEEEQEEQKSEIIPVEEEVGVFSIDSLSLELVNDQIEFGFSGSVTTGPLAIGVIGFTIRSDIKKFKPEIDLEGLQLALDNPPVSISGSLAKEYASNYSGLVSIGFKTFNIVAIGEYASVRQNGKTFESMFIYGFLGGPLGGPAFLYVTGLAAGFGINRRLNLPKDPEQIYEFPLLAVADSPATEPLSFEKLKEIQQDLIVNNYIPVARGQYWLAIGIRLESFKMIKSFVVLAIQFGEVVEINVLGLATLDFPAVPKDGVSQIAKIRIGVIARIIPEQGVIDIRGAFLPGSYIYHPNAHISGGFAMLAITKDQVGGEWDGAKEGDFVMTMGGYAPSFKPKPYYPQVPRLKINWQVSSRLRVSANAYFALTPQAMMLGGHMEAIYRVGGKFSVSVEFAMGMDFIMYWQPVYYSISAYARLTVHGRVDFLFIHESFSFGLSASLDIWGPEFSGSALIEVNAIVSFSFRINFGNAPKGVKKIRPKEFIKTCLPDPNEILTITVAEGLVVERDADQVNGTNTPLGIPVLNAKEATIIVNTAVPIKKDNLSNTSEFGLRPVLPEEQKNFESYFELTITKDGKDSRLDFDVFPIRKNLPKALWALDDDMGSEETLVENLLCGYRITACPSEEKNPKGGFEEKRPYTIDGGNAIWKTGNERQTESSTKIADSAVLTQLKDLVIHF